MYALIIVSATCALLVVMVLAWVVFTMATLKKQMVYTDELNSVIDQLNALTHAIHRAYMRNADGLDSNKAGIETATESYQKLKTDFENLQTTISSIGTGQLAQDAFITKNKEDIRNVTDIVTLTDTVVNPADYMKKADFDTSFGHRLASDQSFTLGASEITLAGSDESSGAAKIKYVDQEMYLGTDVNNITITNSGIKHCAGDPPVCIDIPTPSS